MKFLLGCEVSPSSVFGLPDGDVLVLPSPGGPVQSPFVHPGNGVRVRPGTLPQYRRLDAAFQIQLATQHADLEFVDNFLELRFDATSESVALAEGLAVVDRFLQLLALEHGRCFTVRALFLENHAQQLIPLPLELWHTTITTFDHTALRDQMTAAASHVQVSDPVFEKATEYYQHALYLSAIAPRPDLSPFALRTAEHLVAASFLFLWKALSVIVGDPSVDRGDYQRRYRRLGYDREFFEGTVERLRGLRNEEDVAHYRLDAGGLETIRQEFGNAKTAVRDVIRMYAKQLATQEPQK